MHDRSTILVVDDERDLVELLAVNLDAAGYRVVRAFSGDQALAALGEHLPDLVILDLMMPGLSGADVLRRVRANPRTARLPVIMLTARGAEADQVVGLSLGADDYITKPFSMKVLTARVEAILRRAAGVSSVDTLTLGPVRVDLLAREAFVSDELLKLTPTEYRLLCALVEASGRTLTRQQLVEYAMGPGITVTDRVIDVHVAALRRKLGDAAEMIRTVRGSGYRAVASPAPGPGPASVVAPHEPSSPRRD